MDKDEIRQMIWDVMEGKDIALFPRPVHGRIPNFKGADAAARKMEQLDIWREARFVKCNPDSPQRPVREAALQSGKTIYMAVPRLREEKCFIRVDPDYAGSPRKASTIRGAFRYGRAVHPHEMNPVDLVVAGSVAVDRAGGRVGKGGGYSDLEYALGREFSILDEDAPIVTTVHPIQVLDIDIPMLEHDVPIDFIVTRRYTIECRRRGKPRGILWEKLGEEMLESIPILKILSKSRKGFM
ncbi:MAG: 5-formyltetrahydrofolate cyclo-ligase [Thermoplasmata archaeon]